MSQKSLSPIAVAVVCCLLFPRTLLAQYIDPGASSLLWQLLLTGIVGASFMLRSRIGGLYQRIRYRRRGETSLEETVASDSSSEVEEPTRK